MSKALVANAAGVKGVLATKFGLPVSSQPISFNGFYKYKRGEVFTDKYGTEQNKKDFGSIYAVFYDNHDAEGKPFVLHGDEEINVSLKYEPKSLTLTIKDDGDGFDTSAIPEFTREDNSGFGLSMMKERIYLLSGKISISSKPGEGCIVRVIIPVNKED